MTVFTYLNSGAQTILTPIKKTIENTERTLLAKGNNLQEFYNYIKNALFNGGVAYVNEWEDHGELAVGLFPLTSISTDGDYYHIMWGTLQALTSKTLTVYTVDNVDYIGF